MKTWQALNRRLHRWLEYALSAMGMTMALLVAVQVFSRYVLNHSIFWSEELARFLLIWLTFIGAAVAYHRGVHPGIDLAVRNLPPAGKKTAGILTHLAAMLLFAVMVFYGVQFAYFVRLQVSPALALPKWIVFAIIPVSGFILLLQAGLSLTLLIRSEDP